VTPSNKPGADQATAESEDRRTSVLDKPASAVSSDERNGSSGSTTPEQSVDHEPVLDTKVIAVEDPADSTSGSSAADPEPSPAPEVDEANVESAPPAPRSDTDDLDDLIGSGGDMTKDTTTSSGESVAPEDVAPTEIQWVDQDTTPGVPPWQRVNPGQAETIQRLRPSEKSGDTPPHTDRDDDPIYATDKFDKEDPALQRSAIATAAMAGAATIGRTSVTLGESEKVGPPAPSRASGSVRRSPRGPRRASLQVKRVDPWSVLKLALVLSVVLFFVWLVAVGVLYIVLDGMGTWSQLNGAYGDLVRPEDGGGGEELISAGRVFGAAALIGAVNIILFTALATVGAFVYNIAADLVGGVEVTLSERE
jgi:hypothetical protein